MNIGDDLEMDNLPIQLINSIQQILIDLGQIKGELGKMRGEIQGINTYVRDIDNKTDEIEKIFQLHEKDANAHFLGELKHNQEQHFSVNVQYWVIGIAIFNAGILLYQMVKAL